MNYSILYASSPWNQGLGWPAPKLMNFVQAGRMLSIAIRTHSDLFVTQLEVLARRHRLENDEKLFCKVYKAFKERSMGAVLICAADAKQHVTDILASA